MQEPHRSGSLKQKNKPHKSGRHRSKGEINTHAKGKIALKLGSHKAKNVQNKNDRRYQANQLRLRKKEEVLMKKRQIGGPSTPPFLVAVVPLGFSPVPEKLMDFLMEADTEAAVTCSSEHIFHLSVPRWKQRFSFILPAKGNLYAILDALKACDTVIFLLSAKSLSIIDEASERILTCLLTQGLPSTSVALLDLDTLPVQKRWGYKQDVQRAISRWLPEEKVISLEKNGDGLTLLRRLGSQKQRPVFQRDHRPHILAEKIDVVQEADPDTCTVKVSGYLRGQILSVNGLVHIPGWGDFQMAQIDGPQDPHGMEKKSLDLDCEVLQIADPSRQTSLVTENIPDPMDAEQTWPTPEEMEDAKKSRKLVKKIPKGTSDYQACWIPEEEVDASDEDGEDGEEDEEMEMEANSEDESDSWEECNVVSASDAEAEPEKYDATIDVGEESEMLAKMKAAREEAAFPDEVDTPRDVPARERFCKYRGLASFRTSPWDPKENLPPEFARIFQFENFSRTRKRILKDLDEQIDGTPPGGYVTVHVKSVPRKLLENRVPGEPLVLCGLLPHEHKMSVLNLVVKRSPHSSFCQLPVKSKDPVIVHCGFRRYRARPIYSQHTNGSKHKYERFFQPETTVVATIYAPITFPPASVLLFTESGRGLLATGRVLSANPDRLIIKRVVLSGHPFKVLKRSAVIRFMFFNREDIEWFKPVELRTKYGRRGHIKEPLGTHGHMKAVFDDQLKSQDTVLMTLYKRVFPPWSYELDVPAPPPLYKVLSLIPEESDMES